MLRWFCCRFGRNRYGHHNRQGRPFGAYSFFSGKGNQMHPKQAMEILKVACAAYVGILEDHAKIQTALAVVGAIACPPAAPVVEPKPE